MFDGAFLQYARYHINSGPHAGKTILAFTGTHDSAKAMTAGVATVMSTFSMRNQATNTFIDFAIKIAIDANPHFVTGHSLGGMIAEVVCSFTGIPGASFDAPGVFHPGKPNNLCGQLFVGKQFECHLCALDPFSLMNPTAHIGDPRWHMNINPLMAHMFNPLW